MGVYIDHNGNMIKCGKCLKTLGVVRNNKFSFSPTTICPKCGIEFIKPIYMYFKDVIYIIEPGKANKTLDRIDNDYI